MKEIEENGKCSGQDYYKAIKSVVHHLKSKRNELEREISCDEVQRSEILGEMTKLEDKLSILNANLKKKSDFRREYDKAIAQTEGHFQELVEKSEDFLSMTRRQVLALKHTVSENGNDYDQNQQDFNGNLIGGMNRNANGSTNGNGSYNGAANGSTNGKLKIVVNAPCRATNGTQQQQPPSFETCCNAQPVTIDCSSQPPAAVLTLTPTENQGNCVGCTKVAPCTTILMPFRANGL